MEREMVPVKVYISDKGFVCIEQDLGLTDPDIVVLHPSQVDTVIQWLREALNELKDTV